MITLFLVKISLNSMPRLKVSAQNEWLI